MSELEIATDVNVMPSQCIFGSSDPIEALGEASRVVQYMVQHCKGAEYIASIQGRNYPKVEWWTTAGMGLSLFPREEKILESFGTIQTRLSTRRWWQSTGEINSSPVPLR